MNTPTMTMQDEIENLAAELRLRTAERNAAEDRLRAMPDMRQLVGEIRKAYELSSGEAEKLLRALLRRLDVESQ